jgi:7-carboxy-7-deazaguanine synthase (Cx14CxxC type)
LVKEIFYTLQGEGANSGRPAVFCRFAGCNLWSGREQDRDAALCRFCDTDFVGTDGIGGGSFATASDLARAIREAWPGHSSREQRAFAVLTGGEPALQLDSRLVDALHDEDFEIAVETNGTRPLPCGLDWICVSPKAGTDLVVCAGSELKLVYPQTGVDPAQFRSLEFEHFFLSPMDSPQRDEATRAALQYCLRNPPWRLSVQAHKFLGIR